jgi:endonuclease-3
LFPDPKIPLNHCDPFTLLVSTVLSAQCTDVRVNLVAPILFAKADTPKKMASLDQETIREIIRPCGLSPSKSKAILGLSKIIETEHNGLVPSTFDALEALPGVGHKTASVVMSQAFGEYAFPVDTHIHRLAARWGLSSGKSVVQTEIDLKRLIPKDRWAKAHLQIIYFGRTYCRSGKHDISSCPICSFAGKRSKR